MWVEQMRHIKDTDTIEIECYSRIMSSAESTSRDKNNLPIIRLTRPVITFMQISILQLRGWNIL